MGAAWQAPQTLEQRRGPRGMTATQRQSRRPPPAARQVVFHDDAQRETALTNVADRQPQGPTQEAETERLQILTILQPIERARLAALNAHARLTTGRASSSSSTPSHARPESAASEQRDTSGTQQGDKDAVQTVVQLPCPTRGGSPTAAERPRREGQQDRGRQDVKQWPGQPVRLRPHQPRPPWPRSAIPTLGTGIKHESTRADKHWSFPPWPRFRIGPQAQQCSTSRDEGERGHRARRG